jgi:hypothetical protein
MVQQADRAVDTRSQSMERMKHGQLCGTAWISGSMRAEHGLDCTGLLLVESGPACHSPCRTMAAVSEAAIKEEPVEHRHNLTVDGSSVVPMCFTVYGTVPVPVHAVPHIAAPYLAP